MNSPNYFLADLPPGATLNAAMISEACETLRHNRDRFLAHYSTESLVQILSTVAKRWLDEGYPFRQRALAACPERTGFTRQVMSAGLDAFFSVITAETLKQLIIQELGHEKRLDEFSTDAFGQNSNRKSIATGPQLLVHVTGGMIPNPALTSIVLGLLAKSAQFVKCASGTSLLPLLFAHSLYDEEPKLGACLEIAEWKGGDAELEKALFAQAQCVTATGSDETLEKIRQIIPKQARFIGYGHRLSFAYLTADWTGADAKEAAAAVARDVAAWDQLGCLSPHVVYVETGGKVSPEQFAEVLAGELERHEQFFSRRPLNETEAGAIAYRRSFYQMRAANSPETLLFQSSGSTAWTVVYESDPRFQLSCLNRFIYVKAVQSLDHALQGAEMIRPNISTVGLGATLGQIQSLATQLARWGATRVCPVGKMQAPALAWRHDGRPALADLITWTDLE